MSLGLFIKRRRVWMPCAFVAVLVLVYALWLEPKVAPSPPLPSPNGYDDFVKAGQLLATTSSDYRKMSREELKSFVGTNQEPLRLVRLGLTRECEVPTEDSMAYLQKHWTNLTSKQRLVRLLAAESRLAESEENFDEAVKIYLEIVRFGQASAHRGLMLDKMVGAADSIGGDGVERVASRLSESSCKATISALEEIDAQSDSAALYIERERQWSRKATGWRERVHDMWQTKSFLPDQQTAQRFTAMLLVTSRHRRQLLLNLASRAYELEHGKRPLRAEELVPSVLRAIPKDPETGTNLVLNLSL